MLMTFKSIEKENKKRLIVIANVIEARLASITEKFETLGSNFSHEIRFAKLLASIATTIKVFPGFFFYYAPLTVFGI